MVWRLLLACVTSVCFMGPLPASAVEPASPLKVDDAQLEATFQQQVLPVLKQYCQGCHGTRKQEGKLDLSGYSRREQVVADAGIWEIVLQRVQAGEMPPETSSLQPSDAERQALIDWIKALQDAEATRHAGDPGIVLARRLSNAEFDYTIRDLTGVNLQPTREFPVDPANEAGFDNSGESLSMSPALLKKYLAAARLVSDHLVLQPSGFTFAPHPVVAETDRDKFCVQRIVDFYRLHDVDYADYLLAAWRYSLREQSETPGSSLEQIATASGLSPKYLATVWSALQTTESVGPMAEVQMRWRQLLQEIRQESAARAACLALRDHILKVRREFDHPIEKLHVPGNSDGSQPLILWWNRQQAEQRTTYRGDAKDPTLDQARQRFCQVFPNAFYVASRGLYADPNLGANLRLLTAGFHLMQGYFRDDQPLYQMVLDESEQRELDRLWQELNFVTDVPFRQYKDFLFFERAEPPQFAGGPEFDFARPEDKDSTSPEKMQRMRDVYLSKVRQNTKSEDAIGAVERYFDDLSREFRWIEQTRVQAEPRHLEALLEFASRAYRRPLSSEERVDWLKFYHRLRSEDQLGHADAMRDCVASVLLSPHFSYRYDLVADGPTAQALDDYALASRLSYFLWSSMPDAELLQYASEGTLHQSEVLAAQARRMLRDPKAHGLAVEFAGNWLEFRRFEEHNSVDRERFPEFTNDLRQAMYEEPIRFFEDLVQRDGSLLEFLYADHTFVNRLLARHYGMPADNVPEEGWARIDEAHRYGRGGLLPMAVFLTRNSPGLRTSPVKRGYWVVRRLLGEHIPAPPPEVPELPKDEAQLGELTLPQVLARHREHKACAVCHQRFDAIGLAFEGFGPVGERRELDLGQRPVQTTATFPDGKTGDGLAGLRTYLKSERERDFTQNFCRKLLAYALGRGLILSDRQLLQDMQQRLQQDNYHFHHAIEAIVTSPQFLKKRTQPLVGQ